MEDPKRPKLPVNKLEKEVATVVYVILEQAKLEVVKIGKQHQLLSADEHSNVIKKHKKDPADARPDITHQVFLLSSLFLKYKSLQTRKTVSDDSVGQPTE